MSKSEFDKLLISKSKQGRIDGAYSRLFGQDELGALISRVHATSISAGTFLENYISTAAPQLPKEQIPSIFNAALKENIWIVSKKNLKQQITPFLNLKKAIEPDFLIVNARDQQCIVLELKDGDNFDTKKARGEVQNLKDYAEALNAKLNYPWVAKIGVCMFNQSNHQRIVDGFKKHISLDEAMTGSEFCELLGLSQEQINKQRYQACLQNFDFFIEELLKIEQIFQIVKRKVEANARTIESKI